MFLLLAASYIHTTIIPLAIEIAVKYEVFLLDASCNSYDAQRTISLRIFYNNSLADIVISAHQAPSNFLLSYQLIFGTSE
jgi:hypothetical protein